MPFDATNRFSVSEAQIGHSGGVTQDGLAAVIGKVDRLARDVTSNAGQFGGHVETLSGSDFYKYMHALKTSIK